MFKAILFFDPNRIFCMVYSVWIVAIFGHFQNALIFRIIGFLCSLFFAYSNFNIFVETFSACFRQFYFVTQTKYFAWAIAFALWPFVAIIKMLSFFEYSLFLKAVFCIQQLKCVCGNVFRMF